MPHVGEAREGRTVDPDQGIVGQQDQLDVGGTGEGVALDPLDLVVAQQDRGEVL